MWLACGGGPRIDYQYPPVIFKIKVEGSKVALTTLAQNGRATRFLELPYCCVQYKKALSGRGCSRCSEARSPEAEPQPQPHLVHVHVRAPWRRLPRLLPRTAFRVFTTHSSLRT